MADVIGLLQISGLRAQGDLNNQRGGGCASPVSQTHQDQGRPSQLEQLAEAALRWDTQGVRVLDAPGAELEHDALADGHTLPGATGGPHQPMRLGA